MIWFKSAEKPDNLYGEDVYAAVIDEASRVREESYHAVRSTMTATRGFLRAVGNVKGRHNWHFRMCRRAQGGDPDMEFHKIIAADAVEAGVLAAEEIEDARRQLPEQVFRELYLAEPSDDGGNPFGYAAIQRCIKLLSDKPPKWWGVDLAKSTDWTVCIALDANGDTCRFFRFQKPWMDTIEFLIANIKESAYVDSTGVGDPILEALQKRAGNFEGYKFSSTSKQQLMEGLAVAIQQEQIGFPEGLIPTELEQFEYEITRNGVRYSAPEGLHDDCVCSLALAQRRRAIPQIGANILDFMEMRERESLLTK
jgi:phage FluMu gp28-like protein